MPVDTTYRPAPVLPDALGPTLYDEVAAARFPRHVLRVRNARHAARVGLHTLTDAEWIDHFSRFEPLPGNLRKPLALRYHGHQFGVYNPQLGDGRGFLFAQLRDAYDTLLDLGTKGSGRTPWSRGGDGRLTLKGAVREWLATEMLEALGVNTSKTFSVIETGESLRRNDEPSPTRSAVLVRLSHSHVRFGTFQRLASTGDTAAAERVVRYCAQHLLSELAELPRDATTSEIARAVLHAAAERIGRTCGQWMAAGFVHGVLNTDNMNITGESFDYGPWRFLPYLDHGFTAAYFDHDGLYAYGRQPDAVSWNIGRLGEALRPIAGPGFDPASGESVARAAVVREVHRAFFARLGLRSLGHDEDDACIGAAFEFLQHTRMSFDGFFFDWYAGARSAERAMRGPNAEHYRDPRFEPVRTWLTRYEPIAPARLDHPVFQMPEPVTLVIDEVERVWSAIAERDDWSVLNTHIERIRAHGEALALTPSSG